MELIKVVKAIGSFVLVSFIVAMPFMCALSYALNWYSETKFIFTAMTIGIVFAGTSLIYETSEDK
jgi:hypothetical protein